MLMVVIHTYFDLERYVLCIVIIIAANYVVAMGQSILAQK